MVFTTWKSILTPMRNQTGFAACLITCIFLSSCHKGSHTADFFDRKELPQQTIIDGHIDRSSYGRRQMHLEAPRIEQFGEPNPRTVYPEGVKMWIYSDNKEVKAYIEAGYAVSRDKSQITEVRDKVKIIDYQSGDTSYLDELFWNSQLHQIYSRKPVKSVNGNRVTYGDGFESDENFESPLILHQRGTIEWKEDQDEQ